jgi:hypothetical protein
MHIFKNGYEVDEYMPSYGGKKILIAIDSSKSNSAIVVGDVNGNVLDDYEISGKGSETDVYDLCAVARKQLRSLFQGAEILMVGIEDIITKKSETSKNGKSGGLNYHESRYKITAIFDNFIFLFEDSFGVRPKRINNWEWKSHILPEEYRKQTHHKGSKDWFDDLNNRWSGRKDDVTDAVCIYTYLYKFIFKTSGVKIVYELKATAPAKYEYDTMLVPVRTPIPDNVKEFVIDNSDTLEHNLDTIANSIEEGGMGILKVKTTVIPLDWIYSNRLRFSNQCTYNRTEDEIIVLVVRRANNGN